MKEYEGVNMEEEKREKTEDNGGWKWKERRSKEYVGKIRREGWIGGRKKARGERSEEWEID